MLAYSMLKYVYRCFSMLIYANLCFDSRTGQSEWAYGIPCPALRGWLIRVPLNAKQKIKLREFQR